MAYALVDWSAIRKEFIVRGADGNAQYCESAERAILAGLRKETQLRVNEEMPAEKLIEMMAAAIFKRVPLRNLAGQEITETPIPEANVRHITRAELGPILPDGWFIEHQLNRYAACWGEEMTFPARKTMQAAIADIHEFLAASVQQATNDLLASVRAVRASAEEQQTSMWLSSDRP